MTARKRRTARGRARQAPVSLVSALSRCPDCGATRTEVIGPEDLPSWAFPMYGETVAVMGQPGWMFVCERCERVAFAGLF